MERVKAPTSWHLLGALLGAGLGAAAGLGAGAGQAEAPAGDPPRPGPAGERADDAPPPRFQTRRERSLGGIEPDSLLAADLDGDGYTELVAACLDPGRLLLWRGTPEGLTDEPAIIPVGGFPLRPVALPPGAHGALPGRRLVAVASRSRREVTVLDLLGASPDRVLARYAGPGEDWIPRALAVGDPAGDGRCEIAVASERSVAAFAPEKEPRIEPRERSTPRCALVPSGGGGVWIGYQETMDLRAALVPPGVSGARLALSGFPRDLVELEANGSGGPQIAVAGGDRSLWLFDASAIAQGPREIEIDEIPLRVIAADLDGDAREELVILCWYTLGWQILDPPSAGSRARGPSGYAGQTPRDLAVGDFDGDGSQDLVFANRDARVLSFLYGDGDGGLRTCTRARVGRAPSSIACGDLDGDGAPDVAVIDASDNAISVLLNRRGTIGDPPARSFALRGEDLVLRSLRCADLDADGRFDAALLVTGAWGARLVWLPGDGQGGLGEARKLDAGRSGSALLLLDLDADGRPEAIVADAEADEILILRPLGAAPGATPPAPPRRLALPSGPVALAAIELDDDPTPEVAVALGGPGDRLGIAFLDAIEDGDGPALTERLHLAARLRADLPGAPLDIAAGDLDGDGRDDLVLLALDRPGSVSGWVLPMLRRKNGFVRGPARPTGLRPHHLALGDVDGDGRADLFVASQNTHVIDAWRSLFRPEGAAKPGSGLERLDGLGAGLGCLDVALVDLNGDGRLDVLAANAFSDDVAAIPNLGP